ncbi:hypothetical protein Tco_1187859 [Tanacetum coccineum]|uniref:Uncharacterized protein n=1 Tax=Tanacetum coccineum TaxID=301880 RepID=A0ABQ5AP16_9ASTR
MFEFGDELIIDSYRIPWLIWIQLLAMFLLVIIIYYFTTESHDHDHLQFSAVTTAASPSFTNQSVISSGGGGAKVRENEITETGTSTGEVVQRARKSNAQQSEGSGSDTMDDGNIMIFEHSHHPCNFLGLAKQAFLKCLGIDSTPESSTRKRHEKTD